MAVIVETNGVPGPPTGINVIVVGAGQNTRSMHPYSTFNKKTGFGGLTAAIKCHRQGHHVEIYESFPELKILGDIISFGPNAGRIFYRWSNGKIAAKMRAISIDLSSYGFKIHKYDTGEVVAHQKTPQLDPNAPVFNGHRGELHEIVFEYARDELGIPIHLGKRVVQYFEDGEKAGIELESGEKVHILDFPLNLPYLRNKLQQT